jgi:hypothetical protein
VKGQVAELRQVVMRLSVASCGSCTAVLFRPELCKRAVKATAEVELANVCVRRADIAS